MHIMGYYSVFKKDEILPFTATWMTLEVIRLGGLSQAQKDKHHIISSICGVFFKSALRCGVFF